MKEVGESARGPCRGCGDVGSCAAPGPVANCADGSCGTSSGPGRVGIAPSRHGRVYLVATGEVHEGLETYTRHEGAPPPLCEAERLFSSPPVTRAAEDDDVLAALDLPVASFRTEGGAINRAKMRAAILNPHEYLPAGHWLRESHRKGSSTALSDSGPAGVSG